MIRIPTADGVELALWSHGEGDPVLFLHGWPDTHVVADALVNPLVAAGFSVHVADLRGCGESSKPSDVEAYLMRHLMGDVAQLIDRIGGPVHLVGHDLGSNLAWAMAAFQPQSLRSLTALSVGHPTAFRGGGLAQQIRSWYTLQFHFEELPEKWLRANDYEVMRTWLGHPQVDEVIKELERDGQMTTHLNWYRANVPPSSFVDPPPVLPPISVPTLGIWTTGDHALSEEQMSSSGRFCTAEFTYERLSGGHWALLENPDELTQVLIPFLHRN